MNSSREATGVSDMDKNKIDPQEWSFQAIRKKDAHTLINASTDECLTILHSFAQGFRMEDGTTESTRAVVNARLTKTRVEAMDRLTEALNRASRSSTWIGVRLIAVGVGAVVMAVLSYLKS